MEPLPANILAKRQDLPEKPSPVTLAGKYVRLEPLSIEKDAKALVDVSNGTPMTLGSKSMQGYDADALIWRYMFDGPFNHIAEFESSLKPFVQATNGLCFCIFDVATKRQVGVLNLMNNTPAHLKIELGGIWYSPIVQGTLANTESTYLILKHVFGLGYRRVEWKCHSDNDRSRRAALRMGFKFEGIQESHMICKKANRDTAWFRILEGEWPNVKSKLEGMLYHHGSDQAS